MCFDKDRHLIFYSFTMVKPLDAAQNQLASTGATCDRILADPNALLGWPKVTEAARLPGRGVEPQATILRVTKRQTEKGEANVVSTLGRGSSRGGSEGFTLLSIPRIH